MDDRLARIRARTGGPFTLAMARAAEVSDAERRRSLRRGEWLVLRRGVYVEAALVAEADLGQRHALQVAGLRLVVDFDAVAAGPSAARIWGLETLSALSPELVVVTQDAGVAARRRGDCLVRVSELPPQHRTVRHGVPVTSPARTAIDLARGGSFEESVVVVDSSLRSGAVSLADLDQVLLDCYGWAGIGRARQAVAFADPKSESVLESLSRAAMHQQGVPAPRTQVVISDDQGPCGRVDFLWEGVGVIGEADGMAKYEPDGRRTTREIVRAEKRREERLVDAGYEVVRWGWADARNPVRSLTGCGRRSRAVPRGGEGSGPRSRTRSASLPA